MHTGEVVLQEWDCSLGGFLNASVPLGKYGSSEVVFKSCFGRVSGSTGYAKAREGGEGREWVSGREEEWIRRVQG